MKLKRFVAGSLAFIMFNMNLFSYGADAIVDEMAALISDATENQGCQTEHSWDKGEIIAEATCTEEGEIEYTCSECDETKTETISKLSHTWVEGETITEATCTEEGEIEYTCSLCDATKTETISKLAHIWNEGEITALATCTAEGEKTYTCSECDETKIEIINKLPHSWNEGEVIENATCTVEGEMRHTCNECGETKTGKISKLPHSWNEGEETVVATCTEKGELTYTCNECSETKTETVEKLPHSWNEGEETVVATCTEKGELIYTCSECSETKTETVEKLPHNWNKGETITAATCTVEGETIYTCSECSETKTETVEKLPHNWNEGEIVTTVTCTVDGETTYTCSECSETKTETVEKLPHNWNEGEIVTTVTCTVDGETTYTCNECGQTKTETIEKLPHNWNEEGVVTAVTCTQEGKTTYRCNECGQTKTETVEKLPHSWNEGEVTTEATETTVGAKTYTCCECGQTKTEEIPTINLGDGALNVSNEQQPDNESYVIIEPNGSTGYIEIGEIINITTNFDEESLVYYSWECEGAVIEDIYWTKLEGTELEFEPYDEKTYLYIKGTKNGEEIITVSKAYLFDVEAFMEAWDISTYEVESTALTISNPTIEYEGVIGSQKATVSFTISSTTAEEKVISLYKNGSLVSAAFNGFDATATGSQKIDVVVTEKGTYTISLRDSSGIKEMEFTVENGPTFLEIATFPKTGYFLGDTISNTDISSGTLNYGTTFGGVINATPISMNNSKVIVSTNAIDITQIGEYEVSVTYNDGTYSLATSYIVTVADCVIFTPNGSETYMQAEEPIKVETDFDLGENIYYAWSYYKDTEKVTEWIPLTGETVGLKPVGPENYLYIKGIKNGEEKIVRSERYLFFAPIKSLEIINLPKTTVYYVDKANNSLKLEGIKINLIYDMGEKDGIREVSYEELAAYSIELNTPTFAEGIEKITVSYTDRIVNEGRTVSDTFYITNNRSTNEKDEVNKPQVTEGMLPIKWVEAEKKWMITTEGDVEWYDYCAPKESYGADLDVYDNQHWANVMLRDDIVIEKYKTVKIDDVVDEELAGKFVETLGSMFVWIPRYSYSLTNNKLDGLGGADSASVTIPQSTLKTTVYTKIAWSEGTVDTLSNVSPAFSFNGNKINGFWIGKFEASKNADGYIKVLPNEYTFNYVSIEDAYGYAKDMMGSDKDYYQITQTNIDSHMTRNSEWGAVALLTNATADNGQTYTGAIPYINNYAVVNPKTGYAGSTLDKGQVTQASEVGINTFAWDTKEGQKGSTTHNIYGVYDMSGGVGEYVTTYLTPQSPLTNDSKYWEVFDVTKPGSAISEVIISTGTDGMYTIIDSDMAVVYSSGYPFIERGGSYYLGVQAGVFAFNSMNNSNIYQMSGFRPVIVLTGAIEDTPIDVSYTFGTNNSSSSKLAKANDILTVNISATDSIDLAQSNVKIKTGGVEVTGTPVISGNLDSWKIEYKFLDTDTTGNVTVELNGSWTTLPSESTVYFSSSASNGNIITLIPSISGSGNVTGGNVDVEVETGSASIVTRKYAKEETISSAIAPKPMTDENIIPYFADNGINITGKNFTVTENGVYYVYVKEQTGNEYVEKIVIDNIDNVIPVLTITSIYTNNTVHTDYAKNGEKVTVEMEASEEIYTNTANGYNLPTVTIGGRDATVTWTNGSKTGKAEYTIPSNENSLTEGLLTMQIKGYQDKAKNFGTPLTITADKNGNTATYDRTKVQPAISTPSTLTTHGEEVTYTVTFSDNILIDQDKIDITTADFEIVTTGTVTGVIELIDTLVATEKSVKIKEIKGEGTFFLRVLGVNGAGHTPVEDMAGNKTALFDSSSIVNVDTVEPSFTVNPEYAGDASISIRTNNAANTDYATNGDTITLTIKAREAVTTPRVIIMGRTATVTNPSGDHINFIATYLIDPNEIGLAEGQVTFEISNYEEFDSKFNNAGLTHTETTDGTKVTYDKTKPVGVISAPSKAEINATDGNTITYTITYTDTNFDVSTLSTSDVTLIESGVTANIAVDAGTGTTRTVTLSNIAGTGTIGINIKESTAKDKAGNLAVALGDSVLVKVDTVQPVISDVKIYSNNANTKFAKNGDTVTLEFKSSERITIPMVKLADRVATVITTDNINFTATYQIPEDETRLVDGTDITISISGYKDMNLSDVNVNTNVEITATTDATKNKVTYNNKQSELSNITVVTNNDTNTTYATNGNTITISMTSDEGIYTAPTVKIKDKTGLVERNATVVWDTANGALTGTATYTIDSNESILAEGLLTVVISGYKNISGATGKEMSVTSIIYDRTKPVISFNPNENLVSSQNHSVEVTVTDATAGLNSNQIGYAWTTSDSAAPTSWTNGTLPDDGKVKITGSGYTGTYYLWINTLKDKAGNTNSKVSGGFVFDNTAPEIEKNPVDTSKYVLELVSNNSVSELYATNGNTITLTFETDEEVTPLSVRIAGRPATIETINNTAFTASYEIPNDEKALAQGNIAFAMTFEDAAGNQTTIESADGKHEGSVYYDRTKPVVTLGTNGDTTYKTEHSTEVIIKDDESGLLDGQTYKYGWSDNNINEPTYPNANTFTNGGTVTGSGYTGTYYLWIKVVSDKAGNETGPVISNAFNFDNGTPIIEINSIKSNNPNVAYAKDSDRVTIYMTSSEGLYTKPTITIGEKIATVNWTNGATVGTAYIDCDSTVAEGILTIEIKGYKDVAGNLGIEIGTGAVDVTEGIDGSSVIFDRKAPEVSLSPNTNPTAAKTHTTTLSITESGSGLTSNVQYYAWHDSNSSEPTAWNPVSLSSGSATIEGTGLQGTYYLWIKDVEDKAGNKAENKKVSAAFEFDNSMPVFETVTIVSNNANNTSYAKLRDATKPEDNAPGDRVTITMTTKNSEKIYTAPTVTIGGKTATVSDTTAGISTITAYVDCDTTMPEGVLSIRISGYKDSSGNEGDLVTQTTDGSSVYYDRTKPYALSIIGDNTGMLTANSENSVNLTGKASDNTKIVAYAWTTSSTTPTSGWTTITATSDTTQTNNTITTKGAHYFHVKDIAGNTSYINTTVYEMTFDDTDGEGAPKNQYKAHGVELKLPATIPTRVGYTFDAWRSGGDAVIKLYQPSAMYEQDADSAFVVNEWIPNLINVQINHNLQNANDNDYPVIKTEKLTLPYGTEITLASKIIAEGDLAYTKAEKKYKTTKEDGTIVTNSTTIAAGTKVVVPEYNIIIDINYDRSEYTLTLDKNEYISAVTGAGPYRWGQNVSLTATVATNAKGYTNQWLGWTSNNTGLIPEMSQQNPTIVMPIVPDVNGNGVIDDDEKLELTANGTREGKTVTVTFNGNTGTILGASSKSVIYDTPFGDLPTAMKRGYEFKGWYTAPTGGTEVKPSDIAEGTIISEDADKNVLIDLYAHFEASKIKVNFDPQFGTVTPSTAYVTFAGTYESMTDVNGNSLTFPENPTRTGWTFEGWYLNSSKIQSSTTVDTEIEHTLVADWKKSVSITYKDGDTELTTTGTTDSGTIDWPNTSCEIVITSYKPTKAGYKFIGWATSDGATGASYTAGGTIIINENKPLYAVWEAKNVTLSFDAGEGYCAVTSSLVKYDKYFGDLPIPTPPVGHKFTGWYKNDGTKIEASYPIKDHITETTPVNNDTPLGPITLTAQYAEKTFVVLLDAGTNYGLVRTAATEGENGDEIAAIAATYDSTYGEASTYSLTRSANSLTSGNTGTALGGALPTATRTGYTTTGWYTEKEGGTQVTASTTVGSEMGEHNGVDDDGYILYAQFNPNKYKVTLNARGGNVSDSEIWVTYDNTYGNSTSEEDSDTVVGLPTPTRVSTDGVSWTFLGWVNANDESVTSSTTYNVNEPADHTLYANWERSEAKGNPFVITYIRHGVSPETATATYDVTDTYAANGATPWSSMIVDLQTATRSGVEFKGWATAERAQATSVTIDYPTSTTQITISQNITLYAVWEIDLIYVANGGTAPGNIKLQGTPKDFTFNLSAPTEYGNKTLLGWAESSSATSAAHASTATIIRSEDEDLYAVWRMTLTYDGNGGTTPDAEIKTGTAASHNVTLSTSTRTGYRFDGWSDGSNTYAGGASYTLTSNVTLTAVWTPIPVVVTVNHYLENANDTNYTLYKTETKMIETETPVVVGNYVISEGDLAYANYNASASSSSHTTVQADGSTVITIKYTRKTYTIIWKNYDGAELETDANVKYGATPTYDGATPTKPATAQYSYSHNGWTPAVVAVTGDAEYTATYDSIINTYTVIWKNDDGTVLETDENVPYGDMPEYNGATPIKPSTLMYEYEFAGWTPTVSTVTGDAIYTATYDATLRYPMLKPQGGNWNMGWINDPESGYIGYVENVIIQNEPYTGDSDDNGYNDVALDVGDTGAIKSYFNGRDLILAGNGLGKILANPDSSNMFADATYLYTITGLDILDTSNVTDMSYMFSNINCNDNNLVLDLSSFDTSNVTNMQNMFNSNRFGTLDLSSFDTSNVEFAMGGMDAMFSNTTIDKLILGPNFVFGGSHGLTGTWFLEDGTQVDPTTHTRTTATTYYRYPTLKPGQGWLGSYSEQYAIENIVIQTEPYTGDSDDAWPADVGNTGAIMCYLVDGDTLIIAGNGADKIYANPDSSYMFDSDDDKFYWVTEIQGLENIDTSLVTNMSYVFKWLPYLERLDLSNWDTRNVTSMNYMFEDPFDWCSLSELILGPNFVFAADNNLLSEFPTWYLGDGTEVDPTTHVRTGVTTYYSKPSYPMMKPGNTWCEIDTYMDYTVTSVRIQDEKYTGTSDLSWKADVDNEGEIMCYLVGEEIIIAGNGSGRIKANPNSSYMFGWNDAEYTGVCEVQSITGLNVLDVSEVTNMSYMFKDCMELTSLDLSTWNTSSVTNMSGMFFGCGSDGMHEGAGLTSLNISNFNTANVTNMSNMFNNCNGLTSLDVSGFDTTKVTDMSNMFAYCSSLTSLNLSGFNTSNVTNMSGMFRSASCALDFSGFDTTKVTDMSYMFAGSSLTSLNLTGLDTSNVTDMSGMFEGCNRLTSLDISPLNTSNVVNMKRMFWNCVGLTSLNVSTLDTSKATDISGIFGYCTGLTSLDISTLDTSNVTNMSLMFDNCRGLTSLDISTLDTSNVNDIHGIFSSCTALTSLDISTLDTSKVTDMSSMFSNCSSLTSLDVSTLDTTSVTDMSFMFDNLTLTSLDVSTFNTSNVTTMYCMFQSCTNLTNITGLNVFDTSKVTNMRCMFYRDWSLTSLDLSTFNTAQVTDISEMFGGATNLEELTLGTNFSFTGNGSTSCTLPTTTWYLANGTTVNPTTHTRTDVTTYYSTLRYPTLKPGHEWWTDNFYIVETLAIQDASYTGTSTASYNIDVGETGSIKLHFTDTAHKNAIIAGNGSGKIKLNPNSGAMLAGCTSLTTITGIEVFDTSEVTDMNSMFDGCQMTSLDLSSFNTSNVTNMSYMFSSGGVNSLTSLNVSNFDTSNVTNMSYMFKDCGYLESLDLSSFNTANVTNMSYMFLSCDLKELTLGPSFKFVGTDHGLTGTWFLEDGTQVDPTTHTRTDVTTYYSTPRWPTLKPGYEWHPGNMYLVETLTIQDAPYTGTSVASYNIDVDGTGLIKLHFTDSTYKNAIMAGNGSGRIKLNADSSYMFVQNGMDGLNIHTINGLEVFDTSNVTNMANMFYEIKINGELDLSSFDTSNVTDMSQMFYSFSADTLDLSSFDTSSVDPNMGEMSMMFVDLNVDKLILGPNCILESDHCLPTTWFLEDGTQVDPTTHTRTDVTTYYATPRYPMLKPGTGWCGISLDEGVITNIIIQDAPYTGEKDSSWKADVEDSGEIMGYLNGTTIIIAGNGSGKILANPDSSYMFYNDCYIYDNLSSITGLEILDTSNVTNMSNMFSDCRGLTSLNVSNFDTTNVTNMSNMFNGCSGVTSLAVSDFDTSNVTNMSNMFNGCSGVTSLAVSDFDTSNVTNMSGMFIGCSGVTSLAVSNFDTTNVTDMSNMFYGCSGLTSLDISSFDTSNVTNMSGMFSGCSGVTSLAVSNFDTTNVTDMSYMFKNCTINGNLDLSTFNTTNVTDMDSMFYGATITGELDLSSFNTANVTDMDSMFYGATITGEVDLSSFNTANVTDMYSMFCGATITGELDLSSFNTINVTDMKFMFYDCTINGKLDISNFDTTKVTDMSFMFDGATIAGDLDLSHFNTSKVTSMFSMFSGCTIDGVLDVSSFDTSHLTDSMSFMFTYFKGDGINLRGFIERTGNDIFDSNCEIGYVILDQYSNVKPFNGTNVYTWYLEDGTQVDITTHERTGVTTYVSTPPAPMLKPGQGWLGSYSDTYCINNIKIQTDPYNGDDADDSWPADVGDTGAIMTYLVGGNALIIAGNGADKIYANPDSSSLFDSDDDKFYWVTEIQGLNNLDTSKVTNMAGMFDWIYYLEKLDLSNFDTRNVTTMADMFDNPDGYFKELTLGPNFTFASDHNLSDISSTWYLSNGTQVNPVTDVRTGVTTYYVNAPE